MRAAGKAVNPAKVRDSFLPAEIEGSA